MSDEISDLFVRIQRLRELIASQPSNPHRIEAEWLIERYKESMYALLVQR